MPVYKLSRVPQISPLPACRMDYSIMTCIQAILSCQNQSHGWNDTETRRDGREWGSLMKFAICCQGLHLPPHASSYPKGPRLQHQQSPSFAAWKLAREYLNMYVHRVYSSHQLFYSWLNHSTHSQQPRSLSIGSKRVFY